MKSSAICRAFVIIGIDMKDINAILSQTHHRGWQFPNNKWLWYQEWNDALFLHYKVDESLLRTLVPSSLTIDTIYGDAWVSVVMFKMERIRPRILPAVPPISFFNEVNIRTYVTKNNKQGVYFLDIIADNIVSCALAKAFSGLPYKYQRISRSISDFQSDNIICKYKIGESLQEKSDLDLWLTERYCLYNQSRNGYLYRYDIHHLPWNINELYVSGLSHGQVLESVGISSQPNLSHYSSGVKVVAWNKELLK